jgi:hypothetical protein
MFRLGENKEGFLNLPSVFHAEIMAAEASKRVVVEKKGGFMVMGIYSMQSVVPIKEELQWSCPVVTSRCA